jgi:long-chain acyl-CoA synthetase
MTPTKDDIDRAVEGRTVAREFLTTVDAHGSRTALRWMTGEDEWSSLTFDEVADRTARAAAGLRSLGVGHGDRVVLMMRNIPEFHWLDLAVLALGATPVSIYNSSAADQVEYLVGHCAAKVAIVENEGFLEKFLKVRDQLPSLEHIVVLVAPDELPDGVHRHEVLEGDGLDLAEAVEVGTPDDLATIIYTSGTTGNPKGVMITNRNVCWTLESAIHSYGWTRDEMAGKRVVSYLPMAHIAERMVSHYGMIGGGLEVATCPDPSLLTKFLGPVKPNILFGVPRVWEKVYAGLTALIAGDPDNAEKFNRAIEEISPLREKISWGTATEDEAARCAELDGENFALVRALLGIDEVEMAVTGAAPIPAQLIRWFRAIGIPLAEVYGMSENTGPMTFERYKVKPGYVGVPLPGTELKVAEDGEVCCRGGHVFQGYLNDPEKTAETIDDEGWLHSGDIGEIDDDGYVRIVDRKKELIITAGGKNISPANLEAALKTIPLVGQAATIGDNRPFVSALVVIDLEYAPVWAAGRGIEFASPEELAQHPEVVAEIERGVEEAMSQFNNAERVKKVRILAEEWLPDSDLLTPTSKLKRRGIHARFAEEIEAIYTA